MGLECPVFSPDDFFADNEQMIPFKIVRFLLEFWQLAPAHITKPGDRLFYKPTYPISGVVVQRGIAELRKAGWDVLEGVHNTERGLFITARAPIPVDPEVVTSDMQSWHEDVY